MQELCARHASTFAPLGITLEPWVNLLKGRAMKFPGILLAYTPAPLLRWQDQAFKLRLSLHPRYAARPVRPRRPRCAIPAVTHARPPAPLQASALH